MRRVKSTHHTSNLINYAELSLALTGKTTEINKNKVPKEHIKAITQLERYLVRWVNKNKKFTDGIPRVEITLPSRQRILVKMPEKVKKFKIVKHLPSNSTMLHNGLWEFEEKYYTTKLDKDTGLEVKEWYRLEDAKNYLQSK